MNCEEHAFCRSERNKDIKDIITEVYTQYVLCSYLGREKENISYKMYHNLIFIVC